MSNDMKLYEQFVDSIDDNLQVVVAEDGILGLLYAFELWLKENGHIAVMH